MKFKSAKPEDTDKIFEIVQNTVKSIYPKYYLPEFVDAFCQLHCRQNIENDILAGNTYVLSENGQIIGTGTINGNHISRVYVLPAFQKKGCGTFIMDQLEAILEKHYNTARTEASSPACRLYYNRGYRTTDHGSWEWTDDKILVYEIMEKSLQTFCDTPCGLRLRPYKACDARTIISWIQDEASFRKWCTDRYESFPITEKDMNQKYVNCNGDCPDADNFYPMTAFDDSGVTGHLIMRFTDPEKKTLRFGFVIVDNTKRGRGYGKQMLLLALNYAFGILKAAKVTLGVFENNEAAYYCYQAAGFQRADPEKEEIYNISGQNWKCIEMEVMR